MEKGSYKQSRSTDISSKVFTYFHLYPHLYPTPNKSLIILTSYHWDAVTYIKQQLCYF